MTIISNYADGSGAGLALAADLATDLADAQAAMIQTGNGWAVLRNGHVLDWSSRLDRPQRATGTTRLDKPEDFAAFVRRHAANESVVYADRRNARLTAVFNGAPQSEAGDFAPDALAGYGDHRAILDLVEDEDWTRWRTNAGRPFGQRDFGEMIEDLAHTMVDPDGARMLEIALTLTAKSKIDYSSRARLDNGDVSFKFEQDTTVRAGRGASEVDVPSTFIFRVTPWEGSQPVEVQARLRVQPGVDGVLMSYRIMRLSSILDAAFGTVIEDVEMNIPDDLPIFRGSAPEPATTRR